MDLKKEKVLLALLILIGSKCATKPHNLREEEKRCVVLTFENEKGQVGEILFFPRTYAGGDHYSMILTAPIAFEESLLYSGTKDSFINWFTLRGVNIWLVRYPPEMSYVDYARLHLKLAIEKIRRVDPKETHWVLGGISLGGIALLEYLMSSAFTTSSRGIAKIFFLGSGFDYQYPGSLADKVSFLLVEDYCQEMKELCINILGTLPKVAVSAKALWRLKQESISANAQAQQLAAIPIPAMFISGKIDNLAPSESIFPVFERYGAKGSRFYQVSETNFYIKDFHHLDLFTHEQAFSKLYPELNIYLVN